MYKYENHSTEGRPKAMSEMCFVGGMRCETLEYMVTGSRSSLRYEGI